jgi:hypothetical protein
MSSLCNHILLETLFHDLGGLPPGSHEGSMLAYTWQRLRRGELIATARHGAFGELQVVPRDVWHSVRLQDIAWTTNEVPKLGLISIGVWQPDAVPQVLQNQLVEPPATQPALLGSAGDLCTAAKESCVGRPNKWGQDLAYKMFGFILENRERYRTIKLADVLQRFSNTTAGYSRSSCTRWWKRVTEYVDLGGIEKIIRDMERKGEEFRFPNDRGLAEMRSAVNARRTYWHGP